MLFRVLVDKKPASGWIDAAEVSINGTECVLFHLFNGKNWELEYKVA